MFFKQLTREEMIADLVTKPDSGLTISDCVRIVDWLISSKQTQMAEWDRRFIDASILNRIDAHDRIEASREVEHDE